MGFIMKLDIVSYDKIMKNLTEINALSETISSLSENEAISVKSLKTIGYRLMTMSEESMELMKK